MIIPFGFHLHFETQLEIKGLIHVIYVSSYNRIYQEFRLKKVPLLHNPYHFDARYP